MLGTDRPTAAIRLHARTHDSDPGTATPTSTLGTPTSTPGTPTLTGTAESWLESPAHADILYGDPEANAIACGAYAGRKSGRSMAAAAVLCVTYHD